MSEDLNDAGAAELLLVHVLCVVCVRVCPVRLRAACTLLQRQYLWRTIVCIGSIRRIHSSDQAMVIPSYDHGLCSR